MLQPVVEEAPPKIFDSESSQFSSNVSLRSRKPGTITLFVSRKLDTSILSWVMSSDQEVSPTTVDALPAKVIARYTAPRLPAYFATLLDPFALLRYSASALVASGLWGVTVR